MLGGIQGRWDTGKGKISKLEDVDNLKYLKRNTERKKDVLREKDTSELWDNVRGPDKWLRPVKGGVSGKHVKKHPQIFQFSWKLYIPRPSEAEHHRHEENHPEHVGPQLLKTSDKEKTLKVVREKGHSVRRNEDKDKVRKAVGAARRGR